MNFFYPPQPTRLWPSSSFFQHQLRYDDDWDAEIKYNGWRVQIHKYKNQLLIYNRHATLIDINPTIFENALSVFPDNSIFDGELIDRRTKDLKNIIVLWDCMFFDDNDIRKLPLKERRPFLEPLKYAPVSLKSKSKGQVFRAKPHSKNIVKFYDNVIERDNDLEEGIVIKNINSPYEYSLKSKKETANWYKIRKIGEHALV